MSNTQPKIPFHLEMEFTYGEPREIWTGVRRVVANNQGPLTHNGTNTYIVGKNEVALIDPGPEDSTHVSALLEAIKGEKLTHILLTHTHKDHSGALKELKERTGAAVFAHAPVLDKPRRKTQSRCTSG